MTTLVMARLVEERRLSWDQPVRDLLPGFPVADPALSQTITVQDLVCACSGVPRRDMEFLFNAETLDAEAVIGSLAGFELAVPSGSGAALADPLETGAEHSVVNLAPDDPLNLRTRPGTGQPVLAPLPQLRSHCCQ